MLLHRHGLHLLSQRDAEGPLHLRDHLVGRHDGLGLELRDDTHPLVQFRPEIGLRPAPGLAGLANSPSEVDGKLLRCGGTVDVPVRHALPTALEPLRHDRIPGAPDPDGSGDLGPELRTIPAYGKNRAFNGYAARARSLFPAKFANQGTQSVKPK